PPSTLITTHTSPLHDALPSLVAQQQRVRPPIGGREIFRESVAQPHMYAALHLFGAKPRVEGAADVVSRHDALDPTIFAEDHDLGGVAEGQVGGLFLYGLRSAG